MRLREADHALELARRRRDALLVRARVLACFAERDVASDELVAGCFSDSGAEARAGVGDVGRELFEGLKRYVS